MQVPTAVSAEHVMHVSVQALLQQTPSTQKPVVHCDVPEQAWPLAFFATQTPDAQNWRPVHSPSFMHPWHTVPAHIPVGQGRV